MAIRRKGNTAPRIVHESWSRMPNGEVEKSIRWEGFEPDLQSISLQYQAQGYETNIDQLAGAWKQMRVTVPNAQSGGDQPVDIWEISTEFAQVDIRNNPNVIALVAGQSDPAGTLREWVRNIKSILEDGTGSFFTDPGFQQLYNFYAAGGEAFEQERLVVRHRSMLPNVFFQTISLEAVPKFYSKSAFVDAFGVPDDIAGELPSAGDTPPDGFQWGYRRRIRDSIINRGEGRRENVRDWVFTAWSTLAYTYVP